MRTGRDEWCRLHGVSERAGDVESVRGAGKLGGVVEAIAVTGPADETSKFLLADTTDRHEPRSFAMAEAYPPC